MSETKEFKHIREVFKDFNLSNKAIMNAGISSINLIKKTNTLEVSLLSEELIEISSIYAFEKYLGLRFQIPNINIKIENNKKFSNEEINIDELIKSKWNQIIDYMSFKHPLSKAILENSTIEIEDNKLNITLYKKGKELLKSNKFENLLSISIQNIYGKKYKVTYTENLDKNASKIYQEEQQKLQEEVIKKIQQENYNNENVIDEKQIPPIDNNDINDVVTNDDYLQELEKLEEDEDIILGKPTKAKENFVKIKEIKASNKNITIEGRLVTSDIRETKTGKGLIIFEIYDGSAIITCKSFSSDIKEGNEVIEKIKNSSGIKVTRKSSAR